MVRRKYSGSCSNCGTEIESITIESINEIGAVVCPLCTRDIYLILNTHTFTTRLE